MDEKAAQKAEKEAETASKKAKREAKRKAEEEEKQRKKEEEERKARSQMKLNSYFNYIPPAPKGEKVSAKHVNGQEGGPAEKSLQGKVEGQSVYEKTFKRFFVKNDVAMAKAFFEMDAETREAKARILDEYMEGRRGTVRVIPFNPAEALSVPAVTASRGRVHPRVQEVMAEYNCVPSAKPVGLTSES
jgi:chromatin assembly factor 1 subunit A